MPILPVLPVLPSGPTAPAWPLFGSEASRAIEQQALAAHPPNALMQRAGLAVARLAMAIAPHAQRVWVCAGPGNNGGDALVAARHLAAGGREVQVSLLADPDRYPPDARTAFEQARAAGVAMSSALPGAADAQLCLDGLLGLGQRRAPEGAMAHAIGLLNSARAPVLAIDLPTGLCSDTGRRLGSVAVRADHSLALLTLKPGLFTGEGRDHAGRVWLDALGVQVRDIEVSAWLARADRPPPRRHAQHKGSFGDVIVLGGADGMAGAALLAARAALTAGAGRVYVARLGGDALAADDARPEIMPRRPAEVLQAAMMSSANVVCGCGGGTAVAALLPEVLARAARLVLDADALNALAADAGCWALLKARTAPTVLTPHPLEAARLLGCSPAQVQADRSAAARALADRSGSVVLLKGSGTVLAAPGRTEVSIIPCGNGRLATAGSGDVLAGWLGAWLGAFEGAASAGPSPQASAMAAAWQASFDAACATAWWHGRAAETGDPDQALRAGDLADAMAQALAQATSG